MTRALLLLLSASLATACAGPTSEERARAANDARHVSIEWLKERPARSPWGATPIPANRRPHYFCSFALERPEASICTRDEASCAGEATPKRTCEPHARAACAPPSEGGACFPTIASCEAARLAPPPPEVAVEVVAAPVAPPPPARGPKPLQVAGEPAAPPASPASPASDAKPRPTPARAARATRVATEPCAWQD